MRNDISCVINAHREGNILFPTIVSVRRAVEYAILCGLKVDIHIVMDNSDVTTKELVQKEVQDSAQTTIAYDVDYRDLALSRNFAATQSTGTYTAFVDGDDLWSRTWLVDSFVMAERYKDPVVLHPEFNIFFGDENSHVFNHVDMDDQDFEIESLYRMNYWTALSFAKTSIYVKNSYKKNTILDGFGYEDWTWNFETISKGIKHKVVPGTVHFIRKGRAGDSLLAQTNKLNAIPRILDIYHSAQSVQNMEEQVEGSLAVEITENPEHNSNTAENKLTNDGQTINDEAEQVVCSLPVSINENTTLNSNTAEKDLANDGQTISEESEHVEGSLSVSNTENTNLNSNTAEKDLANDGQTISEESEQVEGSLSVSNTENTNLNSNTAEKDPTNDRQTITDESDTSFVELKANAS